MNKLLRLPLLFALPLVVLACATTIDLPPVGVSDGSRSPGSIIWHDLLTDTPAETRQFYSDLFGWEFEDLPGAVNYQLIRHQGRAIGGLIDQNRLPNESDISQWVVAMSVTDIEAASAQVSRNGGTVLTPPTSLGRRGQISIVTDSSGALLSLLQTAEGDPVDYPDPLPAGSFLWHELWVPDPDLAASFYRTLAPLEVEALELEGLQGPVQYRLLRSDGTPRVGIRSVPATDMAPMWVSYLRMESEAQLVQVLQRVEALGGQVLVPATRRPGGGSLAIILGPSGAGVALQTWPQGDVSNGSES